MRCDEKEIMYAAEKYHIFNEGAGMAYKNWEAVKMMNGLMEDLNRYPVNGER